MRKWKNIVIPISFLLIFTVIWKEHPAKNQVNELESELSNSYAYAGTMLKNKVEELLTIDFSMPLNEVNEAAMHQHSYELRTILSLLFSRSSVHPEWEARLRDAEIYLWNYEQNAQLSVEDAADLYQILQATRYIMMDFSDFSTYGDRYEAMHSEHHEMKERVKMRLAAEYS